MTNQYFGKLVARIFSFILFDVKTFKFLNNRRLSGIYYDDCIFLPLSLEN